MDKHFAERRPSPEQTEHLISPELPETERIDEVKADHEHDSHDHSLHEIQKSIHKEAVSAKEVTVGEHRKDSHQPTIGLQRELKAEAYEKTIEKVRGHLNPVEHGISKLIHNPVVEPVSELGSKTIARPSGILGGGLAALIGSGIVLYMAKHYGFEYNFTTFLLLLVFGFAAGLIVELLTWLLVRRKRS